MHPSWRESLTFEDVDSLQLKSQDLKSQELVVAVKQHTPLIFTESGTQFIISHHDSMPDDLACRQNLHNWILLSTTRSAVRSKYPLVLAATSAAASHAETSWENV